VDIVSVILCTAALFFALAFGGKALEAYRLRRHNAMLTAQVAELQAEKARLEDRLEYVGKPEYAEAVAREQYKWAKAGETLVVAALRRYPVSSTNSPSSSPNEQPVPDTAQSLWSHWWSLLTGAFD
jgi:hypothetical protein